MTATMPSEPTVLEASDDELRQAVNRTLARARLTFAQLEEQARTGRFDSVRARLAWVAIGDLGHLAK